MDVVEQMSFLHFLVETIQMYNNSHSIRAVVLHIGKEDQAPRFDYKLKLAKTTSWYIVLHTSTTLFNLF